MSGCIAGTLFLDQRSARPDDVESLFSDMSRPIRNGYVSHVDGSLAMGQGGPSNAPLPPSRYWEPERFHIVFDGRLDNWEELGTELQQSGVPVSGLGDAEIVQAIYARFGTDGIAKLDGDFAFAIWDRRQRHLCCVRDRTGNRPFYYRQDSRCFRFASEVRPLAGTPPCTLNSGRLAQFLADDFRTVSETPWRELEQLPAGHYLIVGENHWRIERYWNPQPASLPNLRTIDDHCAYYREFLFDRVRRASRSSDPLAIEVSGGLDSSALFAVAAQLERDGRLLAPSLRAYTLDFGRGHPADEMHYAEAVAEFWRMPLHKVPPVRKSAAEIRERSAVTREFADLPSGNMSLGLRRAASAAGSSTMICGVGGDEWLGDPWLERRFYQEEIALGNYREVLALYRADLKDFGTSASTRAFLRYAVWPFVPVRLQNVMRTIRNRLFPGAVPPKLATLLSPSLQRALSAYPTLSDGTQRTSARESVKHRLLDDPYTAWAWSRVLQSASEEGIALCSPFRSAAMIEWSLAVPAKFQTVGRRDRLIHRQALRGLLPDMVLQRESKADFSAFFEANIRKEKAQLEAMIVRRSDWVDAATVRRLLDEFTANDQPTIGTFRRFDIAWLLAAMTSADGLDA